MYIVCVCVCVEHYRFVKINARTSHFARWPVRLFVTFFVSLLLLLFPPSFCCVFLIFFCFYAKVHSFFDATYQITWLTM